MISAPLTFYFITACRNVACRASSRKEKVAIKRKCGRTVVRQRHPCGTGPSSRGWGFISHHHNAPRRSIFRILRPASSCLCERASARLINKQIPFCPACNNLLIPAATSRCKSNQLQPNRWKWQSHCFYITSTVVIVAEAALWILLAWRIWKVTKSWDLSGANWCNDFRASDQWAEDAHLPTCTSAHTIWELSFGAPGYEHARMLIER